MTRSSKTGRQFNEFELMPELEEVTKENMQTEKRDQVGTRGNSWVSWVGGQQGRRRLGEVISWKEEEQHGQMPHQQRGLSPRKVHLTWWPLEVPLVKHWGQKPSY